MIAESETHRSAQEVLYTIEELLNRVEAARPPWLGGFAFWLNYGMVLVIVGNEMQATVLRLPKENDE